MSKYLMTNKQLEEVKEYLETQTDISSFSRVSMIETLKDLQFMNLVSKRLSYTKFIEQLEQQKIMDSVLIDLPKNNVTRRYVLNGVRINPIEIALSLNPGSHASHGSALYMHIFKGEVSEDIYITKEQSKKPDSSEPLSQKNINAAFSRPMRKTNQVASFSYKGKVYKVHMLNGKNSNNAGVRFIETNLFSKGVARATTLERTIIDCIVRPCYAGGHKTILQALKKARKEKMNLSEYDLLDLLKKLKLKYPYQNSLAYYLKESGYPYEEVRNNVNKDFVFYLDYEMDERVKNDEFSLYVPPKKNIQRA